MNNNQRDGALQYAVHQVTVNYEPNTFGGGMPREAKATTATHNRLEGNMLRQEINLKDDFEQTGERYRSLSRVDQDHLVDRLLDALGKANKPI